MVLHRSEDVLRSKVVVNGYTQAVARARYDYSPRADAWAGEASLAVSHAMLRFTDDQDVRVTAGVQVPLYQQSTGKPEPFFRVQASGSGVGRKGGEKKRAGWETAHARRAGMEERCRRPEGCQPTRRQQPHRGPGRQDCTLSARPRPPPHAAPPHPSQENCWTLNVDRHGRWNVLYDL